MLLTGRIFKCIGLTEKHIIFWAAVFEKNILYYEAESEDKKMNDIMKGETLLLFDEEQLCTFYVDASQFELVQDE